MTLKSYYRHLPERKAPRTDFIKQVAEKCGVSEQTVRNWCLYGIKPQDFKHVHLLSEITGIAETELWEE